MDFDKDKENFCCFLNEKLFFIVNYDIGRR